MDFKALAPVLDGLRKVLDMGVLGYTDLSDKFLKAFSAGIRSSTSWRCPGVDRILVPESILPPSICVRKLLYGSGRRRHHEYACLAPLQSAILKTAEGCYPALKRNGDRYELDFNLHMESLVDERSKMLIMSVQSPTTRSGVPGQEKNWRRQPISAKAQPVLFSDEIHGDLTAEGVKHQSTLPLQRMWNDRLISGQPRRKRPSTSRALSFPI